MTPSEKTGGTKLLEVPVDQPPRWITTERSESSPVNGGPRQAGTPNHHRRADDSLNAMGHLAAAIAHELRQPLSAILALAYHLKASLSPASHNIAESLRLLEQQAELAERILSNLAAFARSGAPNKTSTDLNLVLAGVIRRLAPRPEVLICEELAPNLPAALADPFHVDRIVSNLIANALESMEGSGTLSVATRPAEGCGEKYVVVEVTDTGCGIEPAQADTIFQVFITTKPNGTGLGLALCRELAEANGGSIAFRSQPNRGTTFELRLPQA